MNQPQPTDRAEQAPPMTGTTRYTVRLMRPEEAADVARYHRLGIPTGVLAELGETVLTKLYRALTAADDGFVFVGVDERDRVIGFVAGVLHVGRMYRRVLRRHCVSFALAGARYVFSLRMLRRIWNTLRYPAKVSGNYPNAELLSIVVDESARGSGVATELLRSLLAEFRRRGVDRIRVMVRADFDRANTYYQKHGFQFAEQITTHGHPANIYVIGTGEA